MYKPGLLTIDRSNFDQQMRLVANSCQIGSDLSDNRICKLAIVIIILHDHAWTTLGADAGGQRKPGKDNITSFVFHFLKSS